VPVYDVARGRDRAWVHDVAHDGAGRPRIVYAVFRSATDHRYRHARWTGNAWEDRQLTPAGSFFDEDGGGLAVAGYPVEFVDELVEPMVDAALAVARRPFASVEERVAQWREHPAFAEAFNDDVAAYAGYEASQSASTSEAAVRADIVELSHDDRALTAIDRCRGPIRLLRAPRGLDGGVAMLPGPVVESFVLVHPQALVEEVAGTNHYTLVLGGGPGPSRVAAAVAAMAADGRVPK
jgi:hypothetical protein